MIAATLGAGVVLLLVSLLWSRIKNIKTPFGEIALSDAVEAAVTLTAAQANREADKVLLDETTVSRLLRAVVKGLAREPLERAPQVLWVDDQPEGNEYERLALSKVLDARFVLSTSTSDALEQLARGAFDLVISDVARVSDPRAGYELLREMRSRRRPEPVIFYSSSRKPEHVREAIAAGAVGATNRPDELLEFVRSALPR